MSSTENAHTEGVVPADAEARKIETLRQEMATVEKNLAGEIQRVQRSNRITGVVGVICLVLLIGYFYYGYTKLNDLLQPKSIVGTADGMIVGQLPHVRESLEKEVNDSADEWAARLSEQAYESIPGLRKDFQGYLLEQIDAEIAEAASIPEEEFRNFLRDNHDSLELRFKELASSEEVADAALEELESLMDQKLGYGVHQRATDLLTTLTLMNARLEDLRRGRNLGLDGQLERQVVMICKRLQIQEQGANLEKGVKEMEKEAAGSLDQAAAGGAPNGDQAAAASGPKTEDTTTNDREADRRPEKG